MHLEHLSLLNFRNYVRLDLDLGPGLTVMEGANGQGKSNLLEAIFLLATTRSPRTQTDRELLHWLAWESEQPFARVVGRVQRRRGPAEIAITIHGERADGAQVATKRVRVNGVARRAIDLLGQMQVVLFGPDDLSLVSGPPALRRRFLDLTIAQVEARYVRALAHYQRVLQQRNHLLRQLRERRTGEDELRFWDEELTRHGVLIVAERERAVDQLCELARATHYRLAGSAERLQVLYRPNLPLPEEGGQRLFLAHLAQTRARELAQGVSLAGPHRDDLAFLLDGVDVQRFGSRGQQRTVALALRLAEAAFLRQRSGDEPILLLDDVLSELDAERQRRVLEAIAPAEQVLLTTTERALLRGWEVGRARLLRVTAGRVEEA
ncbi:MAG: DNA replication/repair protein RecF, partial [Chloroflexi bacterium]|nr:DNA replication/repair protein RecF [Chloroflexota bacterium]